MRAFICGLDVGTFKTCAICAKVESSGGVDILASQIVPTQGIKAGRIIDTKKVSACVKEAIERIYKICGVRVRRVYVNIDNPDLKVKTYEEKILFREKTALCRSNVDSLINSIISSRTPLDRKIVHIGFRDFILDNKISCVDPEGHSVHNLRLNIAAVNAPIPSVKDLINSIRGAGLILEEMFPSVSAQALGLFRGNRTGVEKYNILIDIGAGLTKISLLKAGLVKDLMILTKGAQDITEDIAIKLKLSFDCAEQLKIKYGQTYPESGLCPQKIIVKDKLANRIIQFKDLYKIIISNVDNLLQEIKKVLLKLDYEGQNDIETIICGGGSIMEGFLERAEFILERPVKMGFLSEVKDSHIQSQSAIYATGVGLIYCGFKSRAKPHLLSRIKYTPFINIIARAKRLYHEYF